MSYRETMIFRDHFGVIYLFTCLWFYIVAEAKPPWATWHYGGSPHLVTFIVNGQAASKGRWPWQLSLERWNGATWYHTCGAALISTGHVLTAAHCTYGATAKDFRVVLGASNRAAHDEEDIIDVASINEHPDFDPTGDGVPNDICILTLSRKAEENQYVRVGALPEKGADFTDTKCWISGWGKLSGSDTSTTTQLQEVEMPCISNRQCARQMFNVIGGEIDEGKICVFDPELGTGSCQGDSGGPMHCRRSESESWKVAGVTSWGVEGCPGNYPSVYTRTSFYLDWIQQIINIT